MKKTDHINSNDVIFLVMYDISDNYTRRTVVDYLLREGCLRIQRSIFMGNLPFCKMQNIARTLEDIYEGSSSDDSYIIMPLRKESIGAMVICGDRRNIDMILRRQDIVFL